MSAGHAKVILGLMTPAAQVSLATQIVSEQLSVRDAGAVGAEPCGSEEGREATRSGTFAIGSRGAAAKRLGTRVDVQRGRRGGKNRHPLFSPEELDGLVERLLE